MTTHIHRIEDSDDLDRFIESLDTRHPEVFDLDPADLDHALDEGFTLDEDFESDAMRSLRLLPDLASLPRGNRPRRRRE